MGFFSNKDSCTNNKLKKRLLQQGFFGNAEHKRKQNYVVEEDLVRGGLPEPNEFLKPL